VPRGFFLKKKPPRASPVNESGFGRIGERDRGLDRLFATALLDLVLPKDHGAVGNCGVGRKAIETSQCGGDTGGGSGVNCAAAPVEVQRSLGRGGQILGGEAGQSNLAVGGEVCSGPMLTEELAHLGGLEFVEVALERIARLAFGGRGGEGARTVHLATKQTGVQAGDLDARRGDVHGGGCVLKGDGTEDERIGCDGSIELRPGGRSVGRGEAGDESGKHGSWHVSAEDGGLEGAGVQVAEVDGEAGQAGLERGAVEGQVQCSGSLHRAVGEDDRVPELLAGRQVERSLGDLHMVSQVVRAPVGVVQGDGAGQAIGGRGGDCGERAGRRAGNEGWACIRHPGPGGG